MYYKSNLLVYGNELFLQLEWEPRWLRRSLNLRFSHIDIKGETCDQVVRNFMDREYLREEHRDLSLTGLNIAKSIDCVSERNLFLNGHAYKMYLLGLDFGGAICPLHDDLFNKLSENDFEFAFGSNVRLFHYSMKRPYLSGHSTPMPHLPHHREL